MTLSTEPEDMMAGAEQNILLISEDRGNGPALACATQLLAAGAAVTWICSTPTSADLVELEPMAALKNNYMAQLSLLVITRAESQPFEVLSGEFDQQKFARCVSQLLRAEGLTGCRISARQQRSDELAAWTAALGLLPDSAIDTLGPTDSANPATATTTQHNNQPQSQQHTDQISVTVILQGRERSFSMARHSGTLLDGAEDAGLDLPFSCRGGVCSTCRTRLRDGEVELMENYALEDWELEAGFTLPCQAEPVSDQITLDYDTV